jgi:hypothetical protein
MILVCVAKENNRRVWFAEKIQNDVIYFKKGSNTNKYGGDIPVTLEEMIALA